MSSRPSLLFVAPIVPGDTGNGLAMRAGVFLDALALDFQVTLLLVPVAGGSVDRVPRFVAERAHQVVTLRLDGKVDPLWELCARVREPAARAAAFASYPRPALCRYATTPLLRDAQAAVHGERFDAVHVMRSYLAPYAEPFLRPDASHASPFASLDLDDDEAATHRGLAALLEQTGSPQDAQVEAAEAEKYERHEAMWLPRFDRLFACTSAHAQRLASAYPGCAVATMPNTVAIPAVSPRPSTPGKRMLFVGNLSYLPNVEGIRRFALDILPRLRNRFGDSAQLRIAGSAPTPDVAALATIPGVELVRDPAQLAEHYAWADLAVIPLHAGGGTRIKLLEAFAHGVPVVATRTGADGISADDRTHLLLADSSEAFADACAELLSDSALAARLSASARQLVEASYAHATSLRVIREFFRICRPG